MKSSPVGCRYSFTSLLNAIDKNGHSYETDLAALIQRKAEQSQLVSGAFALPCAAFNTQVGINVVQRDLIAGTATAGGNVVKTGLQAVADAARPPLLLEKVGVQRLEVTNTGTVSLPGWIAESGTASQLNTTVQARTAGGKMASARLAISRRMLLQSLEIEAHLLREISQAMAAVIEAGLLMGDGTNTAPTGLFNTTGASTQAFAGATPTYAELLAMVNTAAAADADLTRCCFLMHPTLFATLLRTSTGVGTGEPIIEFEDNAHRLGGFPVYSTRHVTNGKVLFFDPGFVRSVWWGAPQLIADSYSNGKSLSGAMELVLMNLVDIAVLHPATVVAGG